MDPVARPAGVNLRVVWIVTFVLLVVVAGFVAAGAVFVLSMLRMMDRADAHVCGLAAVRHSPVAIALLGTPIVQRGVTGGTSSSNNGELNERMTFNVEGPRGSLFVLAQGRRSPLDSHLDVKVGRDQRAVTIYSGRFDCPELHVR